LHHRAPATGPTPSTGPSDSSTTSSLDPVILNGMVEFRESTDVLAERGGPDDRRGPGRPGPDQRSAEARPQGRVNSASLGAPGIEPAVVTSSHRLIRSRSVRRFLFPPTTRPTYVYRRCRGRRFCSKSSYSWPARRNSSAGTNPIRPGCTSQ
jgi:hypothetical protein